MKYKLIAMDMDGTLLNSRGEITPETKNRLEAAARSGCYITLSTGRSLPGVRSFLHILPINAPLILFNGAMVAQKDGSILFHQTLNEKEISSILSSPYTPENVILWQDNQLFLSVRSEETHYYEHAAGISGQPVSSRPSFETATKLLWIDRPDSMKKRKAALLGSLPGTISYCNSSADYLEFYSSLVSKGTALHFLCNYLGISPEETIAFGDGENDIPLLKAAGLSIAMGNASPEIRDFADYVTVSNDENGIVSALNHFL